MPNAIKIFLRWFIYGNGVIWFCLTLGICIFQFSLGPEEIFPAWVIAGLFAAVMIRLELSKQSKD